MKCSTILLISINIFFLIKSILIVTSGSTVQFIFGQYYYILENHSGVSLFPTLWIVSGCFLLVVSIYGILVSSSENAILVNTIKRKALTIDKKKKKILFVQFQYAILLSLVLVLHVATAIAGIMLGVCHSKEIVSDALTAFVHSYNYDTTLRDTMDWTQSKYQCCGNKGPDDWINYSKSTEAPENLLNNSTFVNTKEITKDISMPASCCIRDSNYTNYRCDNYHMLGCFSSVQEVFSFNVMLASFLALDAALLDLFGAIIAFLISKSIRRVREIETGYSHMGLKNSYR